MYLKRDAAFRSDPYEFVTIGIQFFKSGDVFSVIAVWKDSPAEAEGVVGDRVISVNGHASAELRVEDDFVLHRTDRADDSLSPGFALHRTDRADDSLPTLIDVYMLHNDFLVACLAL
jgi:hypothetical protein